MIGMHVGSGEPGPSTGRMEIVFRSLEKIKITPPGLTEICIQKIASNFLNFPPQVLQKELGRTKQLSDVYAILDCNIPLVIAA